jgi:hypothetical protein
MVVKRIGVLSAAKVLCVLQAGIGLIVGLIITAFSVLGASLGMDAIGDDSGPSLGILFGMGAVAIIPLCYGILGFVGGIIGATIYNVVARIAGGLEVELE